MTIDPARERYVSLATFRRDGTEVRTPVWIATAEGAAVIYTNATSWKVKRIRNNENVRLAPCTARGDIRGDWVDATARIVDHDAGRDRGIELSFRSGKARTISWGVKVQPRRSRQMRRAARRTSSWIATMQ